MGSTGVSGNTPQAVVDFGNGAYNTEMVTYEGVSMERRDARRIDKIKDDLGFLSYRSARTSLSEAELKQQKELQSELRRYRDKYGISVSWYLPNAR